jgi:hypothetical protein
MTQTPVYNPSLMRMNEGLMQGLGSMGGFGGGGRESDFAGLKISGRGYQDDTMRSYSGVATGSDVFHAQVPMREETLAQLARYNINV